MAGQKTPISPIVYYKKHLETRSKENRREYLDRRIRGIVRYAYRHSSAVKGKLDGAGVKPGEIRTARDLEKIPITKKSDLAELQKRYPPFGGLETVPVQKSAQNLRLTRTHP